ncbi:hypothetical protein PFISCL1PPCAC_16342, partial [Pristionchus fissidentatus]
MSFDPFRIVSHLLARFSPSPSSSDPMSRSESKLSDHLFLILTQAAIHELDIEEEEDVMMEDDQVDPDVCLNDIADRRFLADYTPTKTIRFSGSTRTPEEVEEAIHYRWALDSGIPRNRETVKRRFRWVSSEHDWRKLLGFEKAAKIKSDRLANLYNLGVELKAIVYEKLEAGVILHDAQLQEIALGLRDKHSLPDFRAGHSWITKFKKMARIVSRHITKMIIKKVALDRQKLEDDCKATVKVVRDFIASNPTI